MSDTPNRKRTILRIGELHRDLAFKIIEDLEDNSVAAADSLGAVLVAAAALCMSGGVPNPGETLDGVIRGLMKELEEQSPRAADDARELMTLGKSNSKTKLMN